MFYFFYLVLYPNEVYLVQEEPELVGCLDDDAAVGNGAVLELRHHIEPYLLMVGNGMEHLFDGLAVEAHGLRKHLHQFLRFPGFDLHRTCTRQLIAARPVFGCFLFWLVGDIKVCCAEADRFPVNEYLNWPYFFSHGYTLNTQSGLHYALSGSSKRGCLGIRFLFPHGAVRYIYTYYGSDCCRLDGLTMQRYNIFGKEQNVFGKKL